MQSPKKFHALHFSIFSLEIMNMTSKLNLAFDYLLRFLNFDFGEICLKIALKLRQFCAFSGYLDIKSTFKNIELK